MSILNSYTKEEFERILNESVNYTDCLKQLGYNSVSGDSVKALKKKIEEYNLSVEHFSNTRTNTVRTEENVFCKNSTASQKVLRDWYSKGQYTEYKCAICGQKPFWNNKPMTLILDHINGDNHDDRLENLRWVCGNCNMQLDTTNGKNQRQREHKLNYCIDCGTPISRNATRCLKCAAQHRGQTHPQSKIKPSKEELQQILQENKGNFTKVGKLFGITDNAVRKWCKSYDMPYHSKDYK